MRRQSFARHADHSIRRSLAARVQFAVFDPQAVAVQRLSLELGKAGHGPVVLLHGGLELPALALSYFAELGRLIGDGLKIFKSEKFQQTIKNMQ